MHGVRFFWLYVPVLIRRKMHGMRSAPFIMANTGIVTDSGGDMKKLWCVVVLLVSVYCMAQKVNTPSQCVPLGKQAKFSDRGEWICV